MRAEDFLSDVADGANEAPSAAEFLSSKPEEQRALDKKRKELQAEKVSDSMTGFEKFAVRAGTGVQKAGLNARRMLDAGSDVLFLPEITSLFSENAGGAYRKALDENQRYYNQREAQLTREAQLVDDNSVLGQIAEGTTRALVEMPAQLIPGMAAKNTAQAVTAAAATGGAVQGLSTFGQERGDGRTRLEAIPYAVTSGLITALTTKAFGATGVESVFKNEGIQGVGAKILNVLKEAGMEGAEEAVDQFQQDLLERAARNPNKPIADSVKDVLMAGTIGSLVGGLASTAHTALTPESKPSDFQKALDAAMSDVDRLNAVAGGAVRGFNQGQEEEQQRNRIRMRMSGQLVPEEPPQAPGGRRVPSFFNKPQRPPQTMREASDEAQSRQEDESLVDLIMKGQPDENPPSPQAQNKVEAPSPVSPVEGKPAEAPPAPQAPAGTPQPQGGGDITVAVPTIEFARRVVEMSPGDFAKFARGFNRVNLELGRTVTDDELAELVRLRDRAVQRVQEAEVEAHAAEASGDKARYEQALQNYGTISTLPQFFNEAIAEATAKRAPKETPVPPVAANQPAAPVVQAAPVAPVVQPQPVAPPVQPPAAPASQPVQPQPAAKRTAIVSSGKPNGSRVEVEYEIVEANEIRPLVVREVGADQTRQRVGNVASNEQIAQIATNPDINLLSDSPTSTVGAPIVDDAVIAGNGRLSGIIAGYDGGTRGSINYRRALIEKAKELGLGDISNMVMPVLIRRVKRYVSGDKRAFVVESNPQSAALKESVSEAALLDADALGDLSTIEFNDSGLLSAAGVTEVSRRFRAAQRDLTRTTGGSFDTNEANRRVQLASLAKIARAENIPVGDFIGLLESEDGKRVIAEVTKASPRMTALDGDLQIGGDIIRAIRELHSGINAVSGRAFKSLDEWYAERNNNLIKSELGVVGDAILKLMIGSQRSGAILREFFNEYIRQAEYEQTQRKEAGASADIFGEARQPVTGEKIAGRILNIPEAGAKNSPVSGAKPSTEVRPEVKAEAGSEPVTSDVLYHGTNRAFDKFETGARGNAGNVRGRPVERFYFSKNPDAAAMVGEAGGFKQVSVDRFQNEGDYGDENEAMVALRAELQKAIDSGKRVAFMEDDGSYSWVKSASELSDYEKLDSARVYDPKRMPRLLKSTIVGRTVDLTKPYAQWPESLRSIVKEPSALDFYWHDKNPQLLKWMRDNGYNKANVKDSYESGGESMVVLPEAITSFEQVDSPIFPKEKPAEPESKGGVANEKEVQGRKEGAVTAPSDPYAPGAMVQLKNQGPALWKIVRETTDPKFPDERLFDIQNDKTGEIQRNIDIGTLKPAKARSADDKAASKGKSKQELQDELLKLNPALRSTIKDFKTKEQLRDAIKRERSKRGPVADLGAGLPDGFGWSVDGVTAAVENEDLAGFKLNVITKDQAEQITGRPEARGYGGFFFNGEVYLVADNIRNGNTESARRILREEVAHGLLRTSEGLSLLQQALDEGKLRLTAAEKEALLKQGYKDEGNQLLDEFIAKSARENAKWWKDVVLAVKALLARAGLKLSNEDTARILLKQIRGLQTRPEVGQIENSIPASGGEQLSVSEINRINRELNKLNAKQEKTRQDNERIAELEAALGQQDLFATPKQEVVESAEKKAQREEIERRKNRRLVAGAIEDQGGLFAPRGEEAQADIFAAPPAPKTEAPPVTERKYKADLFDDLAPSGADNPEFIRAQVAGVSGIGQMREVENIAETRNAVRQNVFNATPDVTDERTDNAWRIANELTDEATKAGHALRYRSEMGGNEMALPLLQDEIFRYAFKLAGNGNDTLMRFMLDHSADFQTITGGGSTTAGRVQRARQELASSVAFRWLRETMDAERRNAAIQGARILPQETFLALVRDMENLQLNPDEIEAFLNRAQGPNNQSFADIVADAISQGGAPQTPNAPRQPRQRGQDSPALPGFEEIVDSEAGREAAQMLDRYQRSQTEWLNNAERRQSIVRIIVDEALGENRLARYGREDFINRLTERLREAEVPPAIARELAHEVWNDKAAREATETARAQAADENFEQRRAESILNRFQNDQTEWLNSTRQSAAARLIREFLREGATGVTNEVRVDRLRADLVRAGVREATAQELAFEAGQRKAAVQASARIQAQSMTTDQAQNTANRILSQLQQQHAGVEWLRAESSVNQVREIVRQALQGRLGRAEDDTGVDPILQDPTPTVEKIQQALEAVGVDAETARDIGREIETERQNRWANQRVRQMERAARSTSIRSLIEDILNTPYRAQHDPAWRRQMAIRWFESNGLSQEQATVAADMFNREFEAAYQRAAEQVAKRVLSDGAPKTNEQFERLIRSGVLDPSKPWLDKFAEESGWVKPTEEQFRKIAELEEKLVDPELSPSEIADIIEQQRTILRHVGKKDGAASRAMAESFTASLLSQAVSFGRTFWVQFAPVFFAIKDFSTAVAFDPRNALNFADALVMAYRKQGKNQLKYGWQKDAYQFHINDITGSHNELKRVYETTQKLIDSGATPKIRKAAARVQQIYALGRFVFRLMNTIDNTQMSIGREWKIVFYASRAFKEAGIDSPQKISQLIDAMNSVRQSEFDRALDAGLDEMTAGVRADHRATQAALDFISGEAGGDYALKVLQAAENDIYNVVGRRAPGIGPNDEGLISRYTINPLMDFASNLRKKGGLGNVVATVTVGMVNIPLRAARAASDFYGYGLIRYGIHKYRVNRGMDTYWKQSFANELQAKQRRNVAIAGLALAAISGLNALKNSTADDDANKRKNGIFVTGSGPKSKNLRDEWIKNGWSPYTLHILVGGVKVKIPLTRVGEPLFPPFLISGVIDNVKWAEKDARSKGKEINLASVATQNLIAAHAQLLGARGIFQSLNQYQNLTEGGGGLEKNLARMIGGTAAAIAIPFKSSLSQISEMLMGPLDNSSATAILINQLPLIGRPWQKPALNRFGDLLYNQTLSGKLERAGIPFTLQIPGGSENERLYTTLVEKGIAPPELRRYVLEERYGDLTDSQFSDFATKSGALLKQATVRNLSQLQRMTPDEAKKFLQKEAQQADGTAAAALGLEVKPKANKPATTTGGASTASPAASAAPAPAAAATSKGGATASAGSKTRSAGGRIRSSLASFKAPRLKKVTGRIRSKISRGFKRIKASTGRIRSRMASVRRRPRIRYAV